MFEHVPLMLAQDPYDGEAGSEQIPRVPDQQTGDTTTGEGKDPNPQGKNLDRPGNPFGSFLPLIVVFGVLMFFMMGGPRREKKKHAKMLATMTKGNRVVTAGGILGTVVELRDNEVVVKVDENANTRIKFTREAIKSVLQDQAD